MFELGEYSAQDRKSSDRICNTTKEHEISQFYALVYKSVIQPKELHRVWREEPPRRVKSEVQVSHFSWLSPYWSLSRQGRGIVPMFTTSDKYSKDSDGKICIVNPAMSPDAGPKRMPPNTSEITLGCLIRRRRGPMSWAVMMITPVGHGCEQWYRWFSEIDIAERRASDRLTEYELYDP